MTSGDSYVEWSQEYRLVDQSPVAPRGPEGVPVPVTIPIDLAPGVKVVYTTRLGGVSQGDYAGLNLGGKGGDDPQAVAANRAALSAELGLPIRLVDQVHSARALDVDQEVSPSQEQADAMVSTGSGRALGIFAADCLPVLLADPVHGVIGAAHCGRRGLEGGVIASTVELMVSKGARPTDTVATLGPCICGDCYQVGDDVAQAFKGRFPATGQPCRFGGRAISIARAALMALEQAGVSQTVDSSRRICAATSYLKDDGELADLCLNDGEGAADLGERLAQVKHAMCTLENPLWYSHRRAARAGKSHEGRMLALIYRED